MAKKGSSAVWVWCLVVVLAAAVLVRGGEAAFCSAVELSPCLGALRSSNPPSEKCCNKMREQRPCLCGYLHSPVLRHYVNSPRAREIGVSCGVVPQC